jgi:transcriptional regulator with XRE-family HTH domain
MVSSLKLAILQAGRSQRRVAREAGIPETRLSQLVNGWAEPRADERVALARALGMTSPEDLFVLGVRPGPRVAGR